MQLAWLLCICLVGRLSSASPVEDGAQPNTGSQYMMAFPMDDQMAEESAEAAVKTIAEAIVENANEEAKPAGEQDKQPVVMLEVEEAKNSNDDEVIVEPMEILEGQLEAEEGTPKPPRRSLFKRPKIEELRKLLGFPGSEEGPQKVKPLPVEKPKTPLGVFNKIKPKTESTPNGLQISFPLRREDKLRPFGFPILPLQRPDAMRPFGFPDLVQAASSILRRAIIDDGEAQDISKEDKDDDNEEQQEDLDNSNKESNNEDNDEDDDDDDEEEEPMMIVPVPDGKDDPMSRPPLFRRFPLPLPFPIPRQQNGNRPRFPVPPLAPVAFFLPIAQQIMQNIMTSRPQPRAQAPPPPPLLPISPIHPLIHPPMQNFIHILPMQQQFVPMQQQFVPMPQPFVHVQQPMPNFVHAPLMPLPQQSGPAPILIPLPPNMPRPIIRPMPRRMPVHPHHPQMARRMPMPQPMPRMPMPQQHVQFMAPSMVNPMMRRPEPRPMPRLIQHPLPPVNPILFMMSPMPVPQHMPMMAQQQQQVPVFHRPQPVQMVPNHIQFIPRPVPQEDEERIIFVRADPEEQEDDQEVVILVPSDEVEMAPRQSAPRPMVRQPLPPPPQMSPINKIQLLKELLMARQANRQMTPQGRSPRIVEIVQQQLRIIPAHHRAQPVPQAADTNRADSSELYPVYVPYPGPQ